MTQNMPARSTEGKDVFRHWCQPFIESPNLFNDSMINKIYTDVKKENIDFVLR